MEEADLFKLATKVWYSDYEGQFLYWTPPGREGQFFRTRTQLEQYCMENHIPIPKWVWACEEIGFLLDVEEVLANVRNRQGDLVREQLSDEEVNNLQQALDAWAMSLPCRSYDVDYDTVIIIDKEFLDALTIA
jgi:hypothetical protein